MNLCSFCFGFLVSFLYSLPGPTGQFQVICPTQTIVALLGDDVILPCHLEPPISASSETVEWTRPGVHPKYVHVHQDGRLLYEIQNPSYSRRTRLFVDELKHGNVSMKIFKVKLSDEGTYRCLIPSVQKEASVQLLVGAVSSPTISLAGLDKSISAVVLECESKGWYPEPEVLWLDGEGNLLSAGPTETVRGPDDLYTVSSRVTVEKRHSNSFTCRVQQNKTNQTRETKIHVPGDYFAVTHCPIVPACISLTAGFIFIFALLRCRQKRKVICNNHMMRTRDEGVAAILMDQKTGLENLRNQIKRLLDKAEREVDEDMKMLQSLKRKKTSDNSKDLLREKTYLLDQRKKVYVKLLRDTETLLETKQKQSYH
uniref:Ig-like domain-containing protein n=1 Tax=Lates calcarifer TaxID=8187 RepID=A0A4W6DRJ0_LATCA